MGGLCSDVPIQLMEQCIFFQQTKAGLHSAVPGRLFFFAVIPASNVWHPFLLPFSSDEPRQITDDFHHKPVRQCSAPSAATVIWAISKLITASSLIMPLARYAKEACRRKFPVCFSAVLQAVWRGRTVRENTAHPGFPACPAILLSAR